MIPTSMTRGMSLSDLLETMTTNRGKQILIGSLDNYITVWYASPNQIDNEVCVQHSQSYTQYFSTSTTVVDVIAYVINKYNVSDKCYIGDL